MDVPSGGPPRIYYHVNSYGPIMIIVTVSKSFKNVIPIKILLPRILKNLEKSSLVFKFL